jgi:hypothetical protein
VWSKSVLYQHGPFTHAEFQRVFPTGVERWLINLRLTGFADQAEHRRLQVPGQYDWSVAQGVVVECDTPDAEAIGEAVDSAIVRLAEVIAIVRGGRIRGVLDQPSTAGWSDLPQRGSASNVYVFDPDHPGFLSERRTEDGFRHLEYAGFELTADDATWTIRTDTRRPGRPPELAREAAEFLAQLTGQPATVDADGVITGHGSTGPESLLYALVSWAPHSPAGAIEWTWAEHSSLSGAPPSTVALPMTGDVPDGVERDGILVELTDDGWSVAFEDELTVWQDVIRDAVDFLRTTVGGEVWQEDTELICGTGAIDAPETLTALTTWWAEQVGPLLGGGGAG